jgi:hypothetical protein
VTALVDLARVGFSADTSPLKTAADDVQAFGDKTAKAGDQVAKANTQFEQAKTSTASLGSSLGQAKSQVDSYAKSLGDTVDKLLASGKSTQAMDAIQKATGATWQQSNQIIRDVIAAHQESNSIVSQSPGLWSALGSAIGLTGGAVVDHTGKVKALGSAHRSGASDMTEFREVTHSLGPALEQLGLKLSNVTQFSYAARGGMGLLATAIGGAVVVALAKAGDEAEKARLRFEGLAGVTVGDKLNASLKSVESEVGHLGGTLQPAFESLVKWEQLHGPTNMLPPGMVDDFDNAKIKVDQVSTSVKTLFEGLRVGGAGTADALKATNAFFESVSKTGQVTAKDLEALGKIAPAAEEAIARAMTGGTQGAAQFEAAIAKTPVPVQQLIKALQGIAPAWDAGFGKIRNDPANIEDAVNKLETSFTNLWKTISGGENPSQTIARWLNLFSGDMDSLTTAIDNAKKGTDDWNTNLGKLFGTVRIVGDGFKIAGGIVVETVTAIWNAGKTLNDFIDGAIAKLNALADAAVRIARTVADAVAGMFRGGNVSAAGGAGGTEGQSMASPFANGSGSGGDAGTIDLGNLGGGTGGITDNMPAFASGTDNAPGGLARINEQGGEIVNLPGGSQVIPHDLSMQIAAGLSSPPGSIAAAAGFNSFGAAPSSIAASSGDNASLENAMKQVSIATAASGGRITNALGQTSSDVTAAIDRLNAAIAAAKTAQIAATVASAATIAGAVAAAATSPGGATLGGVSTGSWSPGFNPGDQGSKAWLAQFDNSGTPWQQGTFTQPAARRATGGGVSGGGGGRAGASNDNYPGQDMGTPTSGTMLPPGMLGSGDPYYGPLNNSITTSNYYGPLDYNPAMYGPLDGSNAGIGSPGGGSGANGSWDSMPQAWDSTSQYDGSGILSAGGASGSWDSGGLSDFGYFATGGSFIAGGPSSPGGAAAPAGFNRFAAGGAGPIWSGGGPSIADGINRFAASSLDKGSDTIHGVISLSPGEQVDVHQAGQIPGGGLYSLPSQIPGSNASSDFGGTSTWAQQASASAPVMASSQDSGGRAGGNNTFVFPNVGSRVEEVLRSRAEIQHSFRSMMGG